MATVGSAIVCDRLRLYGNNSLCDRLRSTICDPRSFAIIWKPAFIDNSVWPIKVPMSLLVDTRSLLYALVNVFHPDWRIRLNFQLCMSDKLINSHQNSWIHPWVKKEYQNGHWTNAFSLSWKCFPLSLNSFRQVQKWHFQHCLLHVCIGYLAYRVDP